MERFKDLLKVYQQQIVLLIGYVLVAGLAFGIGRFTSPKAKVPDVRVEQALALPSNYSPNSSDVQSASVASAQTRKSSTLLNCNGKIKGASSMIYHVPGDAFYNRTTKPIACFDTEAQAAAAGFKKSGK